MERKIRFVLMIASICFFMLLELPLWAQNIKDIDSGKIKTSPKAVKAKGTNKSAKPDLLVSNINFSPGKPTVDAEITLWVYVKNVGQVRADAFNVQVKVGGESNPPILQVPGLNPDQEWRYSKKVSFNRTGNYIVTVTADAGNDLAETRENNNIEKKTIIVFPKPKPDLVITKINYSPGKPKQHEHLTYWVFVKNIGPGDAGKSHLSITDSMNAYSIWSKVQVPALDSGREWRFEGPRQYNQAGTYYLKAVIDREDKIDETNEQNNELQKKIVVSKP